MTGRSSRSFLVNLKAEDQAVIEDLLDAGQIKRQETAVSIARSMAKNPSRDMTSVKNDLIKRGACPQS